MNAYSLAIGGLGGGLSRLVGEDTALVLIVFGLVGTVVFLYDRRDR